MGKKDLALKTYLVNPVRYADVYNGSVFESVQVLNASHLDGETYEVIGKLIGVEKLRKMQKKAAEKEEQDMCRPQAFSIR